MKIYLIGPKQTEKLSRSTSNQKKSVKRSINQRSWLPKSVSRGDGYGSRGTWRTTENEEESISCWLLDSDGGRRSDGAIWSVKKRFDRYDRASSLRRIRWVKRIGWVKRSGWRLLCRSLGVRLTCVMIYHFYQSVSDYLIYNLQCIRI